MNSHASSAWWTTMGEYLFIVLLLLVGLALIVFNRTPSTQRSVMGTSEPAHKRKDHWAAALLASIIPGFILLMVEYKSGYFQNSNTNTQASNFTCLCEGKLYGGIRSLLSGSVTEASPVELKDACIGTTKDYNVSRLDDCYAALNDAGGIYDIHYDYVRFEGTCKAVECTNDAILSHARHERHK